jgi:hypothetical protein
MKRWIVLAMLIAIGLGRTVAAAQHAEQVEEATQDHSEATVGHEASEGHDEERHHKNHVAFFVGSTEAEEHHGVKEDRDFTMGLDYERRLTRIVGVGGVVDWVVEGNREYLIGVPVYLHVGRHAKFELAAAVQHLSETGENGFVFRTGFHWDFPVGSLSIVPAVFYDFTEEQDFFIFGIGIGKGF